MRGADMAHGEMHAAQHKIGIAAQPKIRLQYCVFYRPREQFFAALRQSLHQFVRGEVCLAAFMRPDFRAGRLEDLQAVDMSAW